MTEARRVLLTGAAGFIGRHCIPRLRERGFEVHAVTSRGGSGFDAGARWHVADLLDGDATARLVRDVRPTHLLHLAWVTEHGRFWTAPENVDWLGATVSLARLFATSGGRRFVASGTCAEYDWNGDGVCVEDRTPLKPATLYGRCKHVCRMTIEPLLADAGASAAWGRVFLLYGPNESPGRLVPSVIRGLLQRRPVPCSQGTQIRDFLHVEDVAGAFVTLLDSDIEGPVNVGSGRGVPLADVIALIAGALDGRDLVQLGALPTAATEPQRLLPDVIRLTHDLNWRPAYTLERGLEATIAWWREHLSAAHC